MTLEWNDEYDNGDGSATPVYSEIISGASVGALQARDIQRLELAGITIKAGVTIVLPFSDRERPDRVTHNVDEYTSIPYRVCDWSKAHGITVVTCEQITIGAANDDL